MIFINLKYGKLSKDVINGLQIQLTYEITDESDNLIKYKITDSEGLELVNQPVFIESGSEETKFVFIPSNKKFKDTFYTVYFSVENEIGEKKLANFNIDLFDILLDERCNINNFYWSVCNLSYVPIFNQIEILDENQTVVATGYKYKIGTNQVYVNKTDTVDISSLPNKNYHYRIKYSCEDEKWTRYFPNEQGLKLLKRDNNYPTIYMKNQKLKKVDEGFKLSLDVIYRDDDLDSLKYTIEDNYSNIIDERAEYDFSPKMDKVDFIYKDPYFNDLSLTLNLEVKDNLTCITKQTEVLRLYKIDNLRRYQDNLYWSYSNYSNKLLNMQTEVLDFYDNIVLKGDLIVKRNSNDPIEIMDTTKINLKIDYYKFRLHVWNKSENVDDYYELPYGTQFTILEHKPPVISNFKAELYRDFYNNKLLKIFAIVNDNESDPFLYTITDSNGEQLFKSTKTLIPRATISLKCAYDFIAKVKTTIKISATDSHNGIGTAEYDLLAFNITELKQSNGFIFSWKLDNMAEENLHMVIEILNKNSEIIFTTNGVDSGYTNMATYFEQRVIPKLDEGSYKFRLKVISDSGDVYYYSANGEEGETFYAQGNRRPSIYVENYDYYLKDENTLVVRIKGTFSDPDNDNIKYFIKDAFNNYLLKQDELVSSPRDFFVEKEYDLNSLQSPRIEFTLEVEDEEGSTNTEYYYVDLFSINNIYRIYNKFYWSYRVFSKKPVQFQLQIIDEEGFLYGVGDIITKVNTYAFNIMEQEIDFRRYDEGNYFFRVKITAEEENWRKYIPNKMGIPFYLKYNNPPEINVLNIFEKSVKELGIEAAIDDLDKQKVRYTIKDNNDE